MVPASTERLTQRWATESAAATEALGANLAQRLPPLDAAPFVIELRGDLGTGKTTLARGVLLALGAPGPIKSPSYTLLEPYPCHALTTVHLDLYRVRDPSELEHLALRDYHRPGHLWLIEWPERGAGYLPRADLSLTFEFQIQQRYITAVAQSERGRSLLETAAPGS